MAISPHIRFKLYSLPTAYCVLPAANSQVTIAGGPVPV